jgi:hypothetical protein
VGLRKARWSGSYFLAFGSTSSSKLQGGPELASHFQRPHQTQTKTIQPTSNTNFRRVKQLAPSRRYKLSPEVYEGSEHSSARPPLSQPHSWLAAKVHHISRLYTITQLPPLLNSIISSLRAYCLRKSHHTLSSQLTSLPHDLHSNHVPH